MPLTMPADTGGDFTPAPEGTHPARCYRVIDLGTQKVTFADETKFKHLILLGWELPDEQMEDGRPFVVHKRYTFSSSDKSNFRKDLESWRGKRFEPQDLGPGGFHISKLLTAPCLLNVVHNVKNNSTFANVDAVVRLPKGMDVAKLTNPPVLIGLEEDTWNAEAFEELPERLKETIKASPEYAELMKDRKPADEPSPQHDDGLDDEIPF